MLIDLPNLRADGLGTILYSRPVRHIARGVYEPGFSFNFVADLTASGYPVNEYPFQPDWKNDAEVRAWAADDHVADYGVCDSWEQIVERWPDILTSPRKFVIGVTPVRRADQSESGGWRWHKWGEYIGTHEPEYEYLYDEVGIDEVWCFHIYEVLV